MNQYYLSNKQSLEGFSFNKQYDQIRNGVNRIRYLKGKQKLNHHKIAHHLSTILHKIQLDKQELKTRTNTGDAHRICRPNRLIFQPLENVQKAHNNDDFTAKTGSPQHKQRKNILQRLNSTKGLELRSRDRNQQIKRMYQLQRESRSKALQQLFKTKKQNYLQIKKLKNHLQQVKQTQIRSSLLEAKQKRKRIEISLEEGRRKVEDHYFSHVNTVRSKKQVKKQFKIKLLNIKSQQLLKLQAQQKEQIDQYEKSLLIEDGLRAILENDLKQQQL